MGRMDEAQQTDAEKPDSLIKMSIVYRESCLVKGKKIKSIASANHKLHAFLWLST